MPRSPRLTQPTVATQMEPTWRTADASATPLPPRLSLHLHHTILLRMRATGTPCAQRFNGPSGRTDHSSLSLSGCGATTGRVSRAGHPLLWRLQPDVRHELCPCGTELRGSPVPAPATPASPGLSGLGCTARPAGRSLLSLRSPRSLLTSHSLCATYPIPSATLLLACALLLPFVLSGSAASPVA